MITASTLLALLITAFELISSYQNGVTAVEEAHEDVQLMFAEVLTEQIWDLNERGAQASLDGLLRSSSLDRVELSWEDSSKLSTGAPVRDAKIHTVIPLVKYSNDIEYQLGELHLYSTLEHLWQEMFSILGLKLLFNFLKTFIVTGVVLFFFHRLTTQHLQKISTHADSLVLGEQYKPLTLDRRMADDDDELQVLANAINGLGSRLQSDFINSETQQARLENLVWERTQHLELANKRLLEKSRLATIGSLVAMVAHELRNPLGTIKASVELLYVRCKDKENLTVIQRIDRNIERCDETVEQLRRLGKKSDSHWVEVDLAQWLDAYLHDKFAVPPLIKLSTDFEQHLPVFVDQFQLDLVVRNVLENARQALAHHAVENGKKISIVLKREGDNVLLRVSDNGVGLNSAIADRAFDPLYTTKQYGFGMGLSISRNLISTLGGEIELSSEGPMCGATVEIRLPLAVKKPVSTAELDSQL